MIMNKAKVIFKMIVVLHYLLVSFVICFVILLLFGDDFGDKEHFLPLPFFSRVVLLFFSSPSSFPFWWQPRSAGTLVR